jgi:hypothetical protein
MRGGAAGGPPGGPTPHLPTLGARLAALFCCLVVAPKSLSGSQVFVFVLFRPFGSKEFSDLFVSPFVESCARDLSTSVIPLLQELSTKPCELWRFRLQLPRQRAMTKTQLGVRPFIQDRAHEGVVRQARCRLRSVGHGEAKATGLSFCNVPRQFRRIPSHSRRIASID